MFTDMRIVIAAVIVVGLALGVFLLWPDGEPDDPPDTLATPSTTTSTSEAVSTTDAGTSTSVDGTQVVETVEEAEAILRELWFGWFEGIYNQDEDRIREVVVLEDTVETARESFGTEFATSPSQSDISFSDTEILRSDDQCLAVWTVMTLHNFREGASGSVHVLRFLGGEWRRLSLWTLREDLWDADCDSQLPS